MIWISVALGLALLGLFLYWQIIIAEGVYLGQRIVTWLYDVTADHYNQIKDYHPEDEYQYVGKPLQHLIGSDFEGLILDVATGTGRLPKVIAQIPQFTGQVIGLDHSRKMLAEAQKANPELPLLIADAMHLPFASNSVPVITCLEALEFFPRPQLALAEMVRVLEPEGLLMTTRRTGWEAKFMPGKAWSERKMSHVLYDLGMTKVTITRWQVIYDQVWARKEQQGHS